MFDMRNGWCFSSQITPPPLICPLPVPHDFLYLSLAAVILFYAIAMTHVLDSTTVAHSNSISAIQLSIV